MSNSVENRFTQKEFLKIICGIMGLCLFVASSTFGYYKVLKAEEYVFRSCISSTQHYGFQILILPDYVAARFPHELPQPSDQP